jgi:mannose-6-phosphate isomerase-like protein (cupin superfamily)
MQLTFDLAKTFVHLGQDGSTVPLEVNETFWQDLGTGKLGVGAGRLVSLFQFDAPWDSWEVHPNGDEIVVLVSGSVEMTLERTPAEGGKTETFALEQPGAFVFVPRGTWHTARPRVPTTMLFVTDGEGTQHRPA